MKTSGGIHTQLHSLHDAIDGMRDVLPIVPRVEIERVFDAKISRLLRLRGSSALTSIIIDRDRDSLLPVQYAAGVITPPHYLSETDPMVGFYIVSPYASVEGNLILPVGIQFLPYGRYVLHVQGLHLDTEGAATQYEQGSLKEDYRTLRPLPIYNHLKKRIDEFPISGISIGAKNQLAKQSALADLGAAEAEHSLRSA